MLLRTTWLLLLKTSIHYFVHTNHFEHAAAWMIKYAAISLADGERGFFERDMPGVETCQG